MLTVRVNLLEVEPPVWREVQVDPELLLSDFHQVLQITMGWRGSHLHRFTEIGAPDPNGMLGPPRTWTSPASVIEEIADLPDDEITTGEALSPSSPGLLYEYDFGDGWTHQIELTERDEEVPSDTAAVLTGGAGACPPEDVGGPPGFDDLRDALAGRPLGDHTDIEPAELIRWANVMAGPWRDYDPGFLDLEAINEELEVRSSVPTGYAPTSRTDQLAFRIYGPFRTDFRSWVNAGLSSGSSKVDAEAAAKMVRPFTWLLDRVGEEGMELTGAGYMPPKVVSDLMRELDWEDQWLGKMNREDLTLPAMHLRETAERLKLIRKYRGKLEVTKAIREIAKDPRELLRLIAERLPVMYDAKAENDLCQLLLLAVTNGGYRDFDEAGPMLASSLELLGYTGSDGEPPSPDLLRPSIIDIRRDLELLSLFQNSRYLARRGSDHRVTEAGRAFARLALTV